MRTLSIGGMGGFELGIRAALASRGDPMEMGTPNPVEGAAFVVADRRSREVLRHHYPSAVLYNSVWEIQDVKRGSIDLICGKFRARDVVLARENRRVAADAGAAQAALRLMRQVRAQYGLFECESALLRRDDGRALQALLAHATGWVQRVPVDGWRSFGLATPAPALGDDAYGVAWRLLDLQYFVLPGEREGARSPMQRERLYVVLTRGTAVPSAVLVDEDDVERVPGAIEGPGDAGMAPDDATAVFDGRSGVTNYSPIVPRRTLPTIHGQNIAIGDEDTGNVRWLTPEECELAFTLPNGYTAQGRRITEKINHVYNLRDAPRYRMIGRDTVPPAIIEWIAGRMNFYIK